VAPELPDGEQGVVHGCDRAIGTGGHLTMPPLANHRAYGSVPRRFGGLSIDQFLYGEQVQSAKAGVGEGTMQGFRRAQPPASLWAEDGRTGRPLWDIEATELVITLTTCHGPRRRNAGADGSTVQ
jgi:hypothetical protein